MSFCENGNAPTMVVTISAFVGKPETLVNPQSQPTKEVKACCQPEAVQIVPAPEAQSDSLCGGKRHEIVCKVAKPATSSKKKGRKRAVRKKTSAVNTVVFSEPQILTKSGQPESKTLTEEAECNTVDYSNAYRAAHVPVTLADEFKTDGLVDSGANVSAVSLDFYQRNLHGRFCRVASPYGLHIRVGDS